MDLFTSAEVYFAWLASLDYVKVLTILWPFLLLDTPRYVLLKVWMLIVDIARGEPADPAFSHCPSVSVILAGHNEASTVANAISSIVGTYPKLEIVVVDDGSTDGMASAVEPYARKGKVKLLARKQRGGKSSCCNWVLNQSSGEIVIVIDADSSLDRTTIWEIVQPFADPAVGVVGGNIRVRNHRRNLLCALQAYEYLHTIFLGRQVTSRMGTMSVASGALGAFRRSAIERCGGWDVGPGEDGDITIRVRKLGYKAVFAPYAVSHTDVPDTWRGLFRQRRRWNRGLVRYKCRKHIDMANPFAAHFRLDNFMLLLNVWFFHICCLFSFWVYVAWMLTHWNGDTRYALLTTYLCYMAFHVVQVVVLMYYSDRRRQDMVTCLVVPFTPIYKIYLRAARLLAVCEETLFRRSFEDNYVPPHVRQATIHW